MLGFDAYTKSVIASIVQQRIRIFLVKRGIIDLPLLKKYFRYGNIATAILDELFDNFRTELREAKVYEDYAFASIFIKEADYDFLSSDSATSIAKADAALRSAFGAVSTILFKGDDKSDDVLTFGDEDLIFGFLKQPQFQREIPHYSNTDSMQAGPSTHYLTGKPFGNTFLSTDKPISDIKSPFYVEFFYRLKPNVAVVLPSAKREYYNYYSKLDKMNEYVPKEVVKIGGGATFTSTPEHWITDTITEPALFNSNFDRGVRLMFNLTSAMELYTGLKGKPDPAKSTPADYYSGIPLVPTKSLPFFTGFKGLFRKLYPLPFLSEFNTKFKTNYRDWQGGYAQTFLAAAIWIFSKNRGVDPGLVKESNYFRGPYQPKWNPAQNIGGKVSWYWADKPHSFYQEMAAAYPFPDSNFDAPYLKWSKSLISFEHDKTGAKGNYPTADAAYLYFPMILGEYIDLSGKDTDNNQLVDKLLKTETVEYLKSLVKTEEDTGITQGVNAIIKSFSTNETNILLLSLLPNQKEKDKNSPFNTSEEEKGLDNMLLNLINFDEE